jgi:hypothetical protein
MSKLTSSARKKLPKSKFAIPKKAPESGSYPVDTENRARNALARVSQHGTPAEKAAVRAKVKREFPTIIQSSYKKPGGGYGRRTYKR